MAATGFQTSFLTDDPKNLFKEIRNFLAGRFVGATRDRTLLREVIKCLYCKVYLNNNFEDSLPDDAIELSHLYREKFSELKNTLPHIFKQEEEILLDPSSIEFVDSRLKHIDFINSPRDVFGDLFEIFIGTGIREEEGQFFTPQNGIDFLVALVEPTANDKIIDPACGAGGFINSAAKYLVQQGVAFPNISQNVFGIDKDSYLANLASTRMSLTLLEPSNVWCGDSLEWLDSEQNIFPWGGENCFDIVLTNPPFGKKIISTSKDVQRTYQLGYKWKLSKTDGRYYKTNQLLRTVPPQVLFVEKCINLLKDNGRLGVVLPESLITSRSYAHVVQFMEERGQIIVVAGMPEDFFKTSGKGGTHTKAALVFFQKNESNTNNNIFMAEAKWCGHDSRGRIIANDDLPTILERYQLFRNGDLRNKSNLGYWVPASQIKEFNLSPRYYNPEIDTMLKRLEETHDLIVFDELVKSGVLEVATGDEVGKLAYGTGDDIPFVRTSDISNWEIKIDPKHTISEEIYQKFQYKQDIRPGDILMVKDGTYLIGTCAYVTEYDTKIVYQSHLYKIRVKDVSRLSPYLLLAILSSEPIQLQIKSKRYTQDIIDSLGKRLYELVLPIPKQNQDKQIISDMVEKAIFDRVEARELARNASNYVVQLDEIMIT